MLIHIKSFGLYIVLLVAQLIAVWGCGDDGEDTPDVHDSEPSSDSEDTSDDGTIEYYKAHCPGKVNEVSDVYYCIVPSGEITADSLEKETQLDWIAGLTYVLDGRAFIGDDAEETILNIEPGALILGEAVTDVDNTAALIIQRNSKIIAEGTKDNPIVFSSAKKVGDRESDDWGGLILNGKAPINGGASEATGEGSTGTYGGDEPDDDSGVLAYVRIEFSGKRITADKEFNGLTLQGVGRGTEIHHVQIHRAGDDSIEFFGGTAEVHHIVLSGSGDDSFDWTMGWQGKAQFVIAVGQSGVSTENGIEADNNETNFDAEPRANPTLYNFSFFNGKKLLFRRGTAATVVNFLNNTTQKCLDIADNATWALAESGELSMTHSVVMKESCFLDDDLEKQGYSESEWWHSQEGNSVIEDFGVENADDESTSPDYRLKADSPLWGAAGAPPADDDFFEATDYIGAMGDDDWTEGWTDYPEN